MTKLEQQITKVHDELLARVDQDADGQVRGIYATPEEAAAFRSLACLMVQVFGPIPFMTEFEKPQKRAAHAGEDD